MISEGVYSVQLRSRSKQTPSSIPRNGKHETSNRGIQSCQKWQYRHLRILQQEKKLLPLGLDLMITG